jgi:AmiR/NasT family two-component response regulator
LVAGIAGAFAVRAVIQQAVGVIIAGTQRGAEAAYLSLRRRAVERGFTLPDTAAAVIAEQC